MARLVPMILARRPIMNLFSHFEPDALFAYMDGGTGSLIVQAIIAVVLGVGTTMKIYWGSIKSWFKKSSVPSEATDTDEA